MKETTKQKISDSLKATIKARGGHWLKGSTLSEAHKQKIKEVAIKKGFTPPPRVKGSKHPPHTTETKEKISKAKLGVPLPKSRGENHYAWKGGVSKRSCLNNRVEAQEWRVKVFERDDYTCQICAVRGGVTLNADHIKPFVTHPELALDLDNGRTLCVSCHRKTDTYGWKMVHKLRKDNDAEK